MMPHQPNLFSTEPPPEPLPKSVPLPGTRRAPIASGSGRGAPPGPWLRQVEVWVRIVVQLYLGLLIVALPWLHFWSDNTLFTFNPAVAAVASSGFVRGVVSGLGILNLYLAVYEALHSRRS